MNSNLKFIGHIETPYNKIEDCPRNIQFNGPECKIIIYKQFKEGLLGLIEGQEILVLYWFDNADRNLLQQTSRRTGNFSGIFSLRTPNRPNPIGAAVIKIKKIENSEIIVRGLDCLNGTFLIDIKPAILNERIDPNSPNQFFK